MKKVWGGLMAAPVPGSQRRVIMFGHVKDFLAATGITRGYISETSNVKELAATYARPGVLMGEVGNEWSGKFEPVDQYGVVKAGPERLILTDVAAAVAPFTQDMDRCVHIGRPKTSPCSDDCACWRNAIEAAVAVIAVIRRKGKPVGGGGIPAPVSWQVEGCSYETTWLTRRGVVGGVPALVSCQYKDCAEETTYPLHMVAMWEGKPICQDCFDEIGPFLVHADGTYGPDDETDEEGDYIKWSDLPPVTLEQLSA